ncbi:hypothetical protein [Cryobacterium sp. PAMC25264]|uniref:hypothetical protein n=1 Tax=Cryobacterium sp. PAMC25264 TaxID=2861288 RepID=UPI001C631F99|nr:hypothetical protein [Cryobacterium sp. PAMC25264]QYF72291.1 hypothetical protein KY500_10535 [Cryobacterium sp. PAMC25264]
MLLLAVHDHAGTIIGAVIDDGRYPTPTPLPPEDYTLARIELSDEQARLSLDELCTRMRVDARSNTLTALDDDSAV